MKKRIAWFLTALMILVLTSACVVGEAGTGAEEKVVQDLLTYVSLSEKIYTDFQWALDAIRRFDTEKTWDNLQIARACVTIVRREITGMTYPKAQLTDIDYLDLMDQGVDVTFFREFENFFLADQKTFFDASLFLHDGVMEGVFLQDEWELDMQFLQIREKVIKYELQFSAHMVDAVDGMLTDNRLKQQLAEQMKEKCPVVQSLRSALPGSPEEIEEGASAVLDEINALTLEENRLTGALENQNNRWEDILEKGDMGALEQKKWTEITGMPPVLFCPSEAWYDDVVVMYTWQTEDGRNITLKPGELIDRRPDSCAILNEDVSLQQVKRYQAELEEAGISPFSVVEEDGRWRALYQYQGSEFVIQWSDQSVMIYFINNPLSIVPRLYFQALQGKQSS